MRYALLCLALLAGCATDPGNRPRTDGGGGGGDGGGGGGDGGDGCSDEAKLVYVVDQNNKLSSFNPPTMMFNDLGTLNCPAQPLATPFSMAVDRQAVAWVLYSSGELFSVNTTSLQCTKTSFTAPASLQNFGMGFATDTAGGTAETLFIAGGSMGGPATMGPSTLATLAFPSLTPTTVGMVNGWPELTGTGDAKLWGFFPSASAPRVAQINKSTGADIQTFNAATLAGQPSAWAFAFWGGDFWIFLAKGLSTTTAVYRMKSTDGSVTTAIANTGRTIVGAGVSTCAPIAIQ